jgi:hypothetical protein
MSHVVGACKSFCRAVTGLDVVPDGQISDSPVLCVSSPF